MPYFLFSFYLLFSLVSWTLPATAQIFNGAEYGKHSLQELGDQFSLPVPVKKLEGARLVLFNYRAAQKLGLNLPSDPKELERQILEQFAVFVDPDKQSDIKLMATRYQDSGSKGEGEARGDGRALWTHELEIHQKDGSTAHVDVVLKGIGQTPLAWLNHSDPGHKDGLQSMEEAVHSFITSESNSRNQLDTTVDLAVIEIPLTKTSKHTGVNSKASITVRVGEQTRMAHLRYFADSSRDFKEIFEYIVRRQQGVSSETRVTPQMVNQYIIDLSKNLANESARYFDLHAVHASPTPGNRTASGSTIDMGTFRYLDAHHSEYSYLFDKLKLGGKYGQTQQMQNYVNALYGYLKEAHYPIQMPVEKALEVYRKKFKETLTDLWLTRLGLSKADQSRLSERTKKKVYSEVYNLYIESGEEEVQFGRRSFKPAAFEPREILGQSFQIMSLEPDKSEKADFIQSFLKQDHRREKWDAVFTPKRFWKTLEIESIQHRIDQYEALMKQVIDELNLEQKALQECADRAQNIVKNKRYDSGPQFYEDIELPILEKIRSGENSFHEMSMEALTASEQLVDEGLPQRSRTNLGAKLKIGVFSGTFDPPHRGHFQTVLKAKEQFGLDKVYVIPNVESPHKSNITSYNLRREMTQIQFKESSWAILPDQEMEEAFRQKDMTGVLKNIVQKNPDAELFQIMGQDSFERFQKVDLSESKGMNLSIIVNRRADFQASSSLPALVEGFPVYEISAAPEGLSSSEIRKSLKMGVKPRGLDRAVKRSIQQKGLYRPAGVMRCELLLAPAS